MTAPDPKKRRPPAESAHSDAPLADASAARWAAEQAELAAIEDLTAAVIDERLAEMPDAVVEMAERVARCQRLRADDRCPGRCVVTGRPRPRPLDEQGIDRLRRR